MIDIEPRADGNRARDRHNAITLPTGSNRGTVSLGTDVREDVLLLTRYPEYSLPGSEAHQEICGIGGRLGVYLFDYIPAIKGSSNPARRAQTAVAAMGNIAELPDLAVTILSESAWLGIKHAIEERSRPVAQHGVAA